MHITVAEMRAKLLARLRGQRVRLADQEVACSNPWYSPAVMLQGLRSKLRCNGEDGISNLLGNTFLEPRNPFEPQRGRNPRREFIAAVLECALLLAVWFYFNVR